MTALAVSGNAYNAVFFLSQRDSIAFFQSGDVTANQGIGKIRHHIVGNAALEIHQIAAERCADEGAAKAAFFAVPHRELCVRGEAECRHGVVLQVVVHIFHPGFLRTAQKNPEGVGEGFSGFLAVLLEEFCQVQGNDCGAFVICHTTAQDKAFPPRQLEGVTVPAVSRRHHIQVGNGSNLLFALSANVGIDQVAAAIPGGKTEAARNFQSPVHSLADTRPEGTVFYRL